MDSAPCWPARIRSKVRTALVSHVSRYDLLRRRGAAMQAPSAIDIALVGHLRQGVRPAVHVLLGGKWRDKVRATGVRCSGPRGGDAGRRARYLDQDSRQ